MLVVLDTNVLISVLLLLAEGSPPAQLIMHWRQGRFDLLTAAGRLINELRSLAVVVRCCRRWLRPRALTTIICRRSPLAARRISL
jgi:predicted nucleic acid-binding protein